MFLLLQILIAIEPNRFGVVHLKPTASQFGFSTQQHSLTKLKFVEQELLIEPDSSEILFVLLDQHIKNVFSVA